MPWTPELFSAPALQQVLDRKRRDELRSVPFFDGLLTGEIDALVESFSGVPELHHPVRGRVRGENAFRGLVTEMTAQLTKRNVEVEDVDVVHTDERGVEEVVLHLDGADGQRVALPVALAGDKDQDGRVVEVRMYFSSWPTTGHHQNRPPLLQPLPGIEAEGIVGEYQRALAAGDAQAVLSTFESGAFLREPAGDAYIHRGTEELRALFSLFFSNGGGIALEHCTITDDGRACALEYNVVAWGRTELPPQAGLSVYVRGDSGKLASARIYDDADPPLG